jgi:ATP-dependent DNA helicase HFM1/MER3
MELTGEKSIENSTFDNFSKSNLVLTTPEKWDSFTRKWRQNSKLISQVSLILIDEAHLLNTEDRGMN